MLVELYHIAYSEETLRAKQPGYLLLDNSDNPRADWREYWPIRHFLSTQRLDENGYYGFFSPRFAEKTGLSYERLIEFIETAEGADVVTFSPQVDIGAFFPNVFVGGDLFEPGFLETSQRFLERIGIEISLSELFMDSRTTVFSNFLIARPSYWRKWFAICEKLYAIAESGDSEDSLRKALIAKTHYREGVERKVFVMEGIASLVLTMNDDLRVRAYNPFTLGWSAQLHRFQEEAVICDALKIAAREQHYPEYKNLFERVRRKVLAQALQSPKENTMKQTPAHDLYNDTILALLPADLGRVAEVGCMRGSLAKVYRQANPACHWIGIDIDADNVEIAATVCQQALCLDIEKVPADEFEQWRDVDAWIFGDTLEHLRDPWAVLSNIRRVLPKNGVVLASIPNAQHWYFQARVNAGLFRYEDDGLFDRTHLRFFTRLTIYEMFQKTGFRIEQAVSRNLQTADTAKYIPHIRAMAEASGSNPDQAETDAMVFQYVIRAVADN